MPAIFLCKRMKPIKIFLASSAELKSDREQFEIFINRKNNQWVNRGVFLKLVIWEDFLDAMSPTRLQDEYNKAIRECDIFVMLFCTKVGKYTAEEFETAFGQFKATNKPFIFTYFKDAPITTGSANKDNLNSLWAFQEKLKQLGHFQTEYKNIEGLREHFDSQLDKLAEEGFIRFEPPSPPPSAAGERKIPHLLTKPPFLPEAFLGRNAELQDIKQKLFVGNHLLLLVNGEGGIGKTSLASHYYHTCQNEYAHVAWVLSENNMANALLTLAGPLALRFADALPAPARLELLLAAMAELPSPCLLVIDNANELDDLETNYLNLRRCPNFHVLLTTRITEFSAAASFRIEGLPEAEALQLFRTHYPSHQAQEDGLFQQIRAAVGGNTLVIELLAKNLHERNRLKTNYSLANLLADLQHQGLLALQQSSAVSTAYQATHRLRREKPEDIIAAMYDLSQLAPEETALLSAFAVLPAESLAFAMLETLLTASENLQQNLPGLAQKGWIEYNASTAAFKCSPVVQEIIKKKNPRLFEDCKPLIAALTEKLKYETGVGHPLNATYEEAAVFARYGASVVAAFAEAKRELYFLCDRIGNYYKTTGNLSQALFFYEKDLQITKALGEADPDNAEAKNNLAISYQYLGNTQTSLGNLEKALGAYEDYARLEKELHDAYPNNVDFKNGLAISYSKLGETHSALGNLDQALGFYEEYTRLEKELYAAYPNNVAFKNGLAISYFKLGEINGKMKKSAGAVEYYKQAAELWSQLVQNFPQYVEFKKNLGVVQNKLSGK